MPMLMPMPMPICDADADVVRGWFVFFTFRLKVNRILATAY